MAEHIQHKGIEFLRIKDYPNYYVSRCGKVYSKHSRRILKPWDNKHGYLIVNMGKKTLKVHRLVANTFLPNVKSKSQVNHLNGNRMDNRVDNLEWATCLENQRHSWNELGRVSGMKGKFSKNNHGSKLVKQLDKEGNLIKIWDCTMDIQRELGIHNSSVSKACLGKLKTLHSFVWEYAVAQKIAEHIKDGRGSGNAWAIDEENCGWVKERSSFGLEIVKGNVSGTTYIHKFGRNPNIDTADGFEAIWNGGGDYTGFNATTAQKLAIFSSQTADTSGTGRGAHTITLPRMLDGNYALGSEAQFKLTGSTPVYTSGAYLRCSRAIINTAGASGNNIGSIIIRQSGTIANIMAVMPVGYNQTMIACDTIPSGTTGYIQSYYASLAGKSTSISNVRLLVRPSGGVFNVKEEFSIATVGTGYVERKYDVPKNDLPEKSDVKIMADSNANTTGVAAGFDLILVNN